MCRRNRLSERNSAVLPRFIDRPDPGIYLGDNYLVLDFETEVNDERFGSALDSRNSLALACWLTNSGKTPRAHFGTEFDQSDLADAVTKADFLVAHNAKYELG